MKWIKYLVTMILVIVAIIIMTLTFVAYKNSGKSPTLNISKVIVDDWEIYIKSDKQKYSLGEPVRLILEVKNFRDEDRIVKSSDLNDLYDIVILSREHSDGSRQQWKWSHHSNRKYEPLIFGPSESKKLIDVTWNQTDDNGNTLFPWEIYGIFLGHSIEHRLSVHPGNR